MLLRSLTKRHWLTIHKLVRHFNITLVCFLVKLKKIKKSRNNFLITTTLVYMDYLFFCNPVQATIIGYCVQRAVFSLCYVPESFSFTS